MLKKLKKIQWWKVLFFIAVYIGILCTFKFVVLISVVDGVSMENTLHDNDILFGSRNTNNLKHGDIIMFSRNDNTDNLVKRVIGTEGDRIRIVDNKIYLNDKELKEDYIKERMVTDTMDEIIVSKGKVFVLGDNRNNSLDSRSSDVGLVDINTQVFGVSKVNLTKVFKSNTVVKIVGLVIIGIFSVFIDFILSIKPKKKGENENVLSVESRGDTDNNS